MTDLAAGDLEGNGPPPKMAEELASRIESLIMERDWPQGEILGSETDLIDQFGVSRAVFREAVRLVEHHGAARMRRGPRGGLVVTAPDVRSVIRPTTLFLDYAGVSTSHLITARTALELSCVDIVAETVDEDGAQQLRDQLEAEREAGTHGPRLGSPHEFHVLIARLSGNPVHLLFIETLTALTFERVRHLPFDEEQMAESRHAHEVIADALIAGDRARAQHLMRRHLGAALTSYRRRGLAAED